MAFQLSPGVNVSEIDLTTVVPSVATSIGAFAGVFTWGPVNEIVTISDEVRLAETFGKPTNDNNEYWFSAANFLAYSNNLKVVRAANTDTTSASSSYFKAKYSGALGNSIRVEAADSNTYTGWSFANLFTDAPANNELHIVVLDEDGEFTETQNTVLETYSFVSTEPSSKTFDGSSNFYVNVLENRSKYVSSNNVINFNQIYVNVTGNTTGTFLNVLTNGTITANVNYSDFSTGSLTLETQFFSNTLTTITSSATGNIVFNGVTYPVTGNVVHNIIDIENQDYVSSILSLQTVEIPILGVISITGTATPINETDASFNATVQNTISIETIKQNYKESFVGGSDGVITAGNIMQAYDLFLNADNIDISLIVTGPANQTVTNHLIDNIAEVRKDCVVFVSPERADVVDNYGDEVTDILSYRNTLTSSSYAFMDCGWKYQYDKYNDVYRWIPLNGDMAGLAARTDRDRDPWYSPAGLTRGVVKNVIKLAWNPNKTDRDDLYVKGINPVVTFTGEGTLLYGDKTLLNRPSAFDRINVRRLFIVLEKAIARAARSSLFEFNDQFTRAQFVNLVEPFLRDVQGRRGITDFRVVCDETNNTGEVIDRNEFIGDIYIKPARSINFIQLNFVAVRTGVSFEEIVGRFG
jgi:phage tail sheath protein FI